MRITVRFHFYFPGSKASLLCLLLLGFTFFTAQAQVAGTFTINSAQPTGGSNFQTFTAAVNSLANGVSGPVVFNVAAGSGPYNERIYIDHKIRTTATNTVTFNCNGVTLTFLSHDADQHAGVLLDSADYVTFDSLVVIPQATLATEYGFAFHLVRDADHNTIRKCKIINTSNPYEASNNDNIIINGNKRAGLHEGNSYCDSNLIIQNVITGGNAGITLSSNPTSAQLDASIKGNQIINNTITDVDDAGILLNGYTDGTLVKGNDITAPHATWTRGIRLANRNENCMITGNRIHNFVNFYMMPVAAISISSSGSFGKEIVVANNLIYDFKTDDEQNGILLRYASFVKILHNTIVLNDDFPAGMPAKAIALSYSTSNIQVLNNIASVTRESGDQNYGLYMEESIPNLISDRNDWYINSASCWVNAIGFGDGMPFYTLTEWQTSTGLDLHSSDADPMFTDVAAGNLIPTQAAIDNMCSYVNINEDINSAARNNTRPDPGAYEFIGAPCTVPVAGVTTALSPTTVCESHPITITLVGHSYGTGQTYQWQSDADLNGSFSTPVGAVQTTPGVDLQPIATLYYRAAVTCGSTTVYSDPVQITVEPALAAGNYTIDPAKATAGANFQSFSDAISAMHCGVRGPVVFDVAPGTYNQQLTIPSIYGLSSSKTVTFNGNGATFNYTSTDYADRAVIKINGADYITIDSFNVNVPGSANDEYGFGIQLINDADHNTVKRCTVNLNKTNTFTEYAGIVMSADDGDAISKMHGNYCDSNLITGNTVRGGYYGITLTSFEDEHLALGNTITNNRILDNHGYGMYIAGTKNTLIEGNEISRPSRTASQSVYIAIYMMRRNEGNAISKNKIHGLSDADKNSTAQLLGIQVDDGRASAASPNIVSNNLLYDFSGIGLQYGMMYANSEYTKFYHNTISLDDSATTTSQPTFGFAVMGDNSKALEFLNNNITVKRKGTTSKACIYISSTTAVYKSDYNNFYTAGGSVGRKSNSWYATLSDWRTASAQDAHSIAVDPVYKNPGAEDFTPTVLPLNNKGVNTGITTDINDQTRSSTQPDIGAIEFFMCSVFPEVHVAADSQTVCTGAPVTFTITNPEATTTYSWYTVSTKGTSFNTGTSYSVNNLTTPLEYWIEGLSNEGCTSLTRTRVKAVNLSPLTQAPVVTVDSITVTALRFKWNAVPGATAYQVSRDGIQFATPTSGATGLTHTIAGLNASDSVSLVVKALAFIDCQSIVSARVSGRTLSNQYFIPNTFTPNGNGQNDVFKVYSNVIKSMQLVIFNQWGEKVFETTNPQTGWDGTYRGKQLPSGVFIYVAKLLLTDGTNVNQKGTINLVR